MPLVSINIPAYNCAAYLAQTLDSVLAQTVTDWECIIVDDASTDDTARVAEAYVSRDPRFKLVRVDPADKKPHPASRNIALAHSTGTWIAPLDGDDWWEPWKLQRQLQAVTIKPDIVLCTCTGWIWRDGKVITRTANINPQTVGQEMLVSCVTLNCVLAKRQAVEEVGGYDPQMLLAEDWDLWMRLVYRYGPGNITGIDEPVMYYRRHDNNTTARYQRNIAYDRKAIRKTIQSQQLLWRRPRQVLKMIDAQLLRELDHLLKAGQKKAMRQRALLLLLLNPLRPWRWRLLKAKWG